MSNQLKKKLDKKRDGIKSYLKHEVKISSRYGLDKFMLNRWIAPYQKEIAKNQRIRSTTPTIPLPIHAANKWFEQDFSDMEWPLLHIYGGTGTGKSHFCRGFIRYILLNKFNYDQGFPTSVEHFDWHNHLQSVKNSFNNRSIEPKELNWQAEIMLIEDIDRQACISRDGSTFSLELYLPLLKQRLEIDRLPTVFISYRDATQLTKFLATDISGNAHNTAKQMAQDISNLVGNTLHVGQSRGGDYRAEIRGNKEYYDKIVIPELKNQKTSKILSLTANYDMKMEW
jgi:hypothetical protein